MAALTWLRAYPDSAPFWIDNGTGRRVCTLIDNIWQKQPLLFDPSEPVRRDVDQLLAALVRIGVPDASRLEKALIDPPKTNEA
jgi:hypothetical protein